MAEAKQNPKILLVDDNEFTRIFFKDVFWIHGLESKYDLMTVENTKLAEDLIDSPKTMPDIIFLDLALPMLVNGSIITTPEAGFLLLKKIKENPQKRHIKVIMYSGYNEKEIQDRALSLGADGYLVKGENMPQELVAFIDKLKP